MGMRDSQTETSELLMSHSCTTDCHDHDTTETTTQQSPQHLPLRRLLMTMTKIMPHGTGPHTPTLMLEANYI
eukprot:864163-Lingulodinium_polyedra.AAC.1